MSAGAISPLDGRYSSQVGEYAKAFSEDALIRQRVRVEVEWLLALAAEPAVAELAPVTQETEAMLRGWVVDADVERIKQIERQIAHDVKAVEYYLKERLSAAGIAGVEFVHFGCTSEDINNIAYSLQLRDGLNSVWMPQATQMIDEVWSLAVSHASTAMPSHTHGQPASPTTLGKELAVFASRWQRQVHQISEMRLPAKFNGAVGTYGAHTAAYPDLDWIGLTQRFVEGFGLEWNPLTTQIEPHDGLAEMFHAVSRFNSVLIDFCRDMWEYISRSYLAQQAVAGEVGSSTMPHKVNPIDFENAEANAGVSSALLGYLASKLAVSRMQRDLSDSSAIRNMGVAIGHSGLAIAAARRGLAKVAPAPEVMASELESQWEVLAEAIQTVMRRYGLPEPYERLKELTRGSKVTREDVHGFVRSLGLAADAEKRLLDLTPATYTGLSAELVAIARQGSGHHRGSSAAADRARTTPTQTPL